MKFASILGLEKYNHQAVDLDSFDRCHTAYVTSGYHYAKISHDCRVLAGMLEEK